MKRREVLPTLAAVAAALRFEQTKAQTQVIHNGSQVVSTGNVVISQSAGGQQYVWDDSSQSWQAISNDAQIVATGNVTVDQTAAGSQTVFAGIAQGSVCTPGEYIQAENGCIRFCSDGCEWIGFCCNQKDSCHKGRCGK